MKKKNKNKKKFPTSRKHRPHTAKREVAAARQTAGRRPKKNGKVACGLFRGTSRGFGFVVPDAEAEIKEDIFIRARAVNGALDGDRVTVRYRISDGRQESDAQKAESRRYEGEILEVTEVGRASVIGTLFYRPEFLGRRRVERPYLLPDDSRLPSAIPLLRADGAREGDKVEALLPAERGNTLCGNVIRVFGPAEDRGANYEAILASCGVPLVFSDEARAEAEARAAEPLSEEGRVRPAREIIFTIDGAGAKDLDDAVSLRALPGGKWLLGVHIADVSEYVKEGTPLDRTALERGTSVYFVDKVVPMLPEALSNGACSLNANEDKYALAAHMTIDSEGRILDTRVSREIIRSRVRGVYSEINDLLEKGEGSVFYAKYRTVLPTLRRMDSFYRILAERSRKRGALELDRKEPLILLDEAGDPCEILARTRGTAEKMIEQFMLAANEGVARLLTERGIPCVYRVHEKPEAEHLAAFVLYAHNLGLSTQALQTDEPRARDFAAILDQAREAGVGEAVSYALLRAMAKAAYSEKPAPHFGLGIPLYCHFTSPIRRLSDLATHRIIKAVLLDGKKKERYEGYAKRAAEAASEAELRALDAERQIEALYKVLYMSRHIGEEFDAQISSVTSFGIFAELENTCVGLIPLSAMTDDVFIYDEENLTLRCGECVYRIGDSVRVRVEEADIPTRKLYFSLAAGSSAAGDTRKENAADKPHQSRK